MLLAALFAIVALRMLGLGLLPLSDPSEGRYTVIAQSMVRAGEWVTPIFPDGTPFLGKPPLHFWLAAVSLKLFGANEFAARLPSAVSGLILLGATLLTGASAFGARSGLLAALFAATTVLGLGYSALSLTDMTLAACVALALGAFALGSVAEEGRRSPVLRLGFFAALGLTMLAKGPVGLVLCGAAIGIWCVLQRDFGWLRRLPWVAGTLLFLAIAAPWYVLAERKNPGFLSYFFLTENVLRFFRSEFGDLYGGSHDRPYGFSWGLTALGFLPWSIPLVVCGVQLWRQRERPLLASSMERFVLAWALAAPLFFSVSRNVALSYVLPSLPGLALLAARIIERSLESEATRRALFATGVGSCAALAAAGIASRFQLGTDRVDVLWLGLALPLCGCAALWRLRRPAAALLPATALLWACSDLAVRTAIRDEFESHGSTAHLAEEMALRPDLASCKILFLGRLPYSAWFYLTQPTHEVREKKSVLERHLAQDGCHVLVFEEDELRHVDTTQWPERLCEHGKYRVFIDRGETAARAEEPAPLGASDTASR